MCYLNCVNINLHLLTDRTCRPLNMAIFCQSGIDIFSLHTLRIVILIVYRDTSLAGPILTQQENGISHIDKDFLDLHDDHSIRELIAEMAPVMNVPMDENLNKRNYSTSVKGFLKHFEKLLLCSCLRGPCRTVSDNLLYIFAELNCEHLPFKGKKAAHFCPCGKFGLCTAHALGRNNLTYTKQDGKWTKCPTCVRQVPVPKVPGFTSSKIYYEALEGNKFIDVLPHFILTRCFQLLSDSYRRSTQGWISGRTTQPRHRAMMPISQMSLNPF